MVKIPLSIEQGIRKFYELIRDVYPTRKIILFGSYAKGRATTESDIDVGVVVNLPDHASRIDITARLFHFASQVDTRIEPKCIFWDEYQNADQASILSEIIRTGREISI